MSTTAMTLRIAAPPAAVYGALTDRAAVAAWMFPDGMSIEVHEFEPRVGGRFRVSLTYRDETGVGKTTARTDTYRGRFVEMTPGARVIETLAFETSDPAMTGEMTIVFDLADAEGGTELRVRHENVPPGIAPDANETGWRMALARLKALVEDGG